MGDAAIALSEAIQIRQAMAEYRDTKYMSLIQSINARTAAMLKDDMGSQFIQNCGRDLAGEIVRSYFDTSDYYITVDQLAERILKFRYENEYDPLAESGSAENIKKNVCI